MDGTHMMYNDVIYQHPPSRVSNFSFPVCFCWAVGGQVSSVSASIIAGETGSTDSLVTGGPKGVPHDTGPP